MKSSVFPFYHTLSPSARSILEYNVQSFQCLSGQPIRENETEPYGMIYVAKGKVSVLLPSDEEREVSLLQLKKGDCCFLSASRSVTGLSFDVTMEAESDAKIYALPNAALELMMKKSPAFATYVHGSISSNFSVAVLFLQDVLFRSIDQRLAHFLYTEAGERGSASLSLTHEQIARHIGSAREVVSRALKRFSDRGIVSLSRGCVTVLDKEALKRASEP